MTIGLECRDLSKTFHSRQGVVEALTRVNFRAREGEFICVVGPSGCGKSTLLRLIAGLTPPSSGEIIFTPSGQASSDIAMVFQEHGIFPWMTVLDNVAFGLEMRSPNEAERRQQALDFIGRVGLAQFAHNYPHQLSVGMRQRVGIARALVVNPTILLLDEPYGSLDAQTRLVMQEDLLNTWREERKLVLFVTHDIEEAVLLGDRILVMSGRPGYIREDLRVPLSRPRDLSDRDHPDVREIKWHIWKSLQDEVRRSVAL